MIAYELYGNTLVAKVRKHFEECEEEEEEYIRLMDKLVTKSDAVKAVSVIKKTSNKFKIGLIAIIAETVSMIINLEKRWLIKTEKDFLDVDLKTPARLDNYVNELPFIADYTVENFVNELAEDFNKISTNNIKKSYILGGNPEDVADTIKENLDDLMKKSEVRLQEIPSSVAKNTDIVIFNANQKVKQKYVWCSALDTSTCLVCGNLHNSIFDSIAQAPATPVHDRCRCFIIPLTKGVELQQKSYGKWISEQNASTQLEILGRSRYEMYKNGMPIDKFVNNGKKLTLKELKNQ